MTIFRYIGSEVIRNILKSVEQRVEFKWKTEFDSEHLKITVFCIAWKNWLNPVDISKTKWKQQNFKGVNDVVNKGA